MWPALVRETHLVEAVAALRGAGVPFLVHRPRTATRTALAVREQDRGRSIEALSSAGMRFARSGPKGPQGPPLPLVDLRNTLRGADVIGVVSGSDSGADAGTDSLRYCVEVEYWSQDALGVLRSPIKGRYQTTLPSIDATTTVSFGDLGPFCFPAHRHSADRLPSNTELLGPSTGDVVTPVDVVYTWVDGRDPNWLARRAAVRGDTAWHPEAANLARFVQREELRYSLRSLRMYAPWVRNVFLVTDQQRPAWLSDADSTVRLVDHREIFGDASMLPVFNSHAIESQIHRIEGLSNNFLYLNDDMFLGAPVTPEEFMTPAGLGIVFLSSNRVPGPDLARLHTPVDAAFNNVRALIQRDFGVTPRSVAWHAPYSLRVDVIEEMADRYAPQWLQTARSRFRSRTDVSPLSSFYQHYALMTGKGLAGTISYSYTHLASPDLAARLDRVLALRSYKCLCLNDSDALESELPAIASLVGAFLEAYYPLASLAERDA